MSERFFEQGKMDDRKAIERDLSDHGINDPKDWRKASDLETPLEGEEGFEQDRRSLEKKEAKSEIQVGAIKSRHWQKQLDVAFQQGDFSLIKTLQRVRPDNIPNPELVRNKLNDLTTSRPSCWEETYSVIREISNLEPDSVVVEGEFTKLFEKYGKEKGILEQLKEFKKATGYVPSPEVVQAKYRSIFAGKKSYRFDTEDLIKDIKGLTGAQPDKAIFQEIVDAGDILQAKKIATFFGVEITSEMIQQLYEVQFEKNGSLDTDRMSELGEKPNQALVEKAYQRIIDKHGMNWMDSIKSLEQATGVKPVFTEEQMRPVFDQFLQNGWYGREGYVGIQDLVEMTGLQPPVDIIEKAAIKIIDGGHEYIDQGEAIKEGISRLRESTGVAFEIPESEIQNRYQKAIADKKAHVISNLYGAFGIKPTIDDEIARQFMLSYMSDTYQNPIPELENVFGVKFKATKEEIEARQNENLEKLNFDGLAKIKELTGKDCDIKNIEAKLIQLLEKEAIVSSEKRGDYSSDWEKRVKQRLEQFNIAIPPEVAVNIYTSLIQNETVHSSNLIKVYQITAVPIPEDLAQQAYRKYLSSDYAYTIKTGQASSRRLSSVSGAFEELFKISGIKPEISNDELQSFYRNSLEEDSWGERGGKQNVTKIAEITGIEPFFDKQDTNQLYKKWILDGKEDRIRNVKEITGIDLELDEETAAHVSQQLEAGIEKVRSGDYEKEEYRERRFDTYSLEQDLRKVGSLTAATGIKPNTERLQSTYSEILASDPYWATKIEQIIKATGVQPTFDQELLQSKGQELLEKGSLRSFERLQAYGEFTFTPEVVVKTYDALLVTNRRYDEYDRKNYYNEDWVDRIKRFKETTGIAPTETQLAAIFSHLLQDGKFARRSYNRIGEAVNLLQEIFGATISEPMARDIYNELFVADNFKDIEEFKKKTGLNPEVHTEVVREKCDGLLQKRDLDTLRIIKSLLNLDSLPLTPEIVQGEYKKLFGNPKFGVYGDKDIKTMYALYDLTQTRPELSADQLSKAYRQVLYSSYDVKYEKFEEVVGAPPSEVDLQNQAYYYLADNTKEKFTKFVEKHKITIPEEVVTRAIERQLEKASINDDFGTFYIKLFSWFEEYTGSKPGQHLVEKVYLKTFGMGVYGLKKQDGTEYKNLWEWLRDKYGLPSRETVQKVYLDQLLTQ